MISMTQLTNNCKTAAVKQRPETTCIPMLSNTSTTDKTTNIVLQNRHKNSVDDQHDPNLNLDSNLLNYHPVFSSSSSCGY
mmetsp:Transcript_58931/g.144146  ORF Transcript_58931/g.144146 Transcript_58931/m.144146 type:complete len:80 (+) Transcript_58931:5-244(+)